MAQGICTKMKSQVGIATTGTLSRLDTGVYEGTLYIGFNILGSKRTKRFELNGSLSVIQEQMTQACFAYIKQYLTQAYEYQEEE
jgi:nicotinamide mononucleotide (NMN) deamidase PncC